LDESKYQEYVNAFNSHNFDKLLQFYAEDVEFNLPNSPPVRGREGIRAFYKQFEGQFVEEVVPNDVTLSRDGRRLSVEMNTSFEFLVDIPDFLKRGPMKKGDKLIGDLGLVCFSREELMKYHVNAQGQFEKILCGVYSSQTIRS
jgi:hypothetical protein